jgi:gamma-glutamylputrescine oxidase
MQLSYWEKDTFLNHLDVVIIGSGIVGLNAAIRLKELNPNLNVTILERNPLPYGASTKNAGFACFGSLSELIDDVKQNGVESMLTLVEKRWKGLQKLRKRLGDKVIDYQPFGGHEVFSYEDTDTFDECFAQIESFNLYLKDITSIKNVFCQADHVINENGLVGFKHLIKNALEGQLHSGKMILALIRLAQSLGVVILNGINVSKFEESTGYIKVITDNNWKFKAKKVLVCTNGFTRNLFPGLEVFPARNQVIISSPIPNLKLKGSFHFDKGYVYFRNIENRILLGGGRNLFPKEESTDKLELTDEIQNFLENFLKKHIVQASFNVDIDMRWSGILGIGKQKSPIITQYSDHIFTAVRLGGMGVAIGNLVAEEAAEFLYNSL